jgi:intracellular multiplication protein IcmO
MAVIRGIDHARHERSTANVVRETRPFGVQASEFLGAPEVAMAVLLGAALLVVIVPALSAISDALIPIVGGYGLWAAWLPRPMPMRLPRFVRRLDRSNLNPQTGRARPAAGIQYRGNVAQDGAQIWANDEDARTHSLYLGTTGSGKTEALLAAFHNALSYGSGCMFIDGKADNKLWYSISAAARRMGREDDLLLINYLVSPERIGSVSNTLNPFAAGSAKSINNLLVSLLVGEADVWRGRATALASSVVPALVWLRDNASLLLDAGIVRDHFTDVPRLVRLSRSPVLPLEFKEPVASFLRSLAGWKDEAFNDEGELQQPDDPTQKYDLTEAYLQFGYVTMQWTQALNSLADTYRAVFRGLLPDIDMYDVVVNRRIVVVMLPSLKVTGDELANLGKIALAAFKEMLGEMLGDVVEGGVEEAIKNKPTISPFPFTAIFDELGAYILEEIGEVFTQGRSLGVEVLAGSQEITGLNDGNQKAANKVVGSTTTKYFMKLEDSGPTKQLLTEITGQSYATVTAGFSADNQGALTTLYQDRNDASVEKVDRVDWGDIRDQTAGEAHMIVGHKVVRMRMFYTPPARELDFMRVQRFLSVLPPEISEETEDYPGLENEEARALLQKLDDPEWSAAAQGDAVRVPELDMMAHSFGLGMRAGLDALECGCVAVAALAKPVAENAQTLRLALAGAGAGTVARPGDAAPSPGELDDDLVIDATIIVSEKSTAGDYQPG